jgi:geranylgeranyl diphosphate synthase, type II
VQSDLSAVDCHLEGLSARPSPPERSPLTPLGSQRMRLSGKFDPLPLLEYLGRRKELVELALEKFLPPATQRPEKLHEAMRYAVLGGGKRLRAMLCMAGAEALAQGPVDPESLLPMACSLELLHCLSLICDDLPALDNSDLRRGRPSCHVQYGEATAILAQQALFALAFALVARQAELTPNAQVEPLLRLLAKTAGSQGMVAGEVEDLRLEGMEHTAEDLYFIHEHKTASLIRTSLLCGAHLVHADDASIASLDRYAQCLGLTFQIVDDLLDETSQAEALGKPVGADKARQKLTFVGLLGLEGARRVAVDKTLEALAALERLGPQADPLRWLAHYVLTRKS